MPSTFRTSLSFLPAFAFIALVASGFHAFAQEDDPSSDTRDEAVTLEERLPPQIDTANPKQPLPDLAYGAYQRGYYLKAFELALPRAQLGDAAAQTLIAELYDKGLGVARDPREATAWYELAADNGNVEARFAFAVRLLEGRYVEPDKNRAKTLLKSAADDGHATASFNYGQLHVGERPTAAGLQGALPYFEYAAENKIPDAYLALSQIYSSGKLNGFPEMEKAKEWLVKAARAGIAEAQVELGIWLANGKTGDPDPEAALRWMRRAAITGNAVARNRLANMYARGIGTKPDAVEAAKWHILASRAGLSDPWLDQYIDGIERESFSKALEEANRWPG